MLFAAYLEPGEELPGPGFDLVLDLRRVVRDRWDYMLPLVYPDDVEQAVAIRLPMPGSVPGVSRLLDLIDYLGVSSVILTMPRDHDLMVRAMDEAAQHGVSITWYLKDPLRYSPPDVFPHPMSVAFSIPSLGSMKALAKFTLLNQSSIKYMLAYNVDGDRGGLPLLGGGSMDYLSIIKLLSMIGYEGYMVLLYDKPHRGRYWSDLNALQTYRDSLGGALADKRLVKLLSSALGEVFGDVK
ncbi:hypothetical protein GCM10007981_09840 [Thermocladium modestius]|uniref:Uncharacterized protein n=1 Tax=Thermocladium modestius TaxID=62609 RepID=A0A830GV67_9CREN|nr:hypothetical protein [Thermocladium modestius]GGP20700.1 hypothetical protein GCM10007981_09840 [Thermocladium modestius]